MRREHIILFMACMLLFANSMNAEVKYKLNIEAATVYLTSASLTSSTSFNLPKGEQEVLFTNVAGNVNPSSIIISATNGVVVQATTFQNKEYVAESSEHIKEIEDSIQGIKDSRVFITNKIDAINRQLNLLEESRLQNSGNASLSVAEIGKMIELINSKREALMNEKFRQELLLRKIDARVTALEDKINDEIEKGTEPGGQLLVSFYAQEATRTKITITYVVPNAGWTPAYDIMIDSLNKPAKLYYKAFVYQSSGLNWKNVQLSLSTGNPTEGTQAPGIMPWHVSLYVPPPTYNQPVASNVTYQNNMVIKAYKKPLVAHDAPSSRVLTSEEIQRMPTQQVTDIVSTTGGVYQSKRGAAISMSGARTSGVTYFTSVNSSGVNAVFDIDLPYTLPSDGKQHAVTIKRYEMPATYRHYVIPKLDRDAFLQAEITNWEDMNLLPGATNIFYEGMYVGQGNIDIRNATDTMTLSLGRDKKIIVKRESDKTVRSQKAIGTNVREAFSYNITIRNTRKANINLVILDQIPVSDNKDVTIEEMITDDCLYNETTGVIRWATVMNGSETKKINFGFSVKYPKGQSIVGLK